MMAEPLWWLETPLMAHLANDGLLRATDGLQPFLPQHRRLLGHAVEMSAVVRTPIPRPELAIRKATCRGHGDGSCGGNRSHELNARVRQIFLNRKEAPPGQRSWGCHLPILKGGAWGLRSPAVQYSCRNTWLGFLFSCFKERFVVIYGFTPTSCDLLSAIKTNSQDHRMTKVDFPDFPWRIRCFISALVNFVGKLSEFCRQQDAVADKQTWTRASDSASHYYQIYVRIAFHFISLLISQN